MFPLRSYLFSQPTTFQKYKYIYIALYVEHSQIPIYELVDVQLGTLVLTVRAKLCSALPAAPTRHSLSFLQQALLWVLTASILRAVHLSGHCLMLWEGIELRVKEAAEGLHLELNEGRRAGSYRGAGCCGEHRLWPG